MKPLEIRQTKNSVKKLDIYGTYLGKFLSPVKGDTCDCSTHACNVIFTVVKEM